MSASASPSTELPKHGTTELSRRSASFAKFFLIAALSILVGDQKSNGTELSGMANENGITEDSGAELLNRAKQVCKTLDFVNDLRSNISGNNPLDLILEKLGVGGNRLDRLDNFLMSLDSGQQTALLVHIQSLSASEQQESITFLLAKLIRINQTGN